MTVYPVRILDESDQVIIRLFESSALAAKCAKYYRDVLDIDAVAIMGHDVEYEFEVE